MKRCVFIIVFLMFSSIGLFAQDNLGTITYATVIDGDTIPKIYLKPAYVVGKRTWKSKKAEKKYNRLVHHVKEVYPYAKLAGQKLREYEKEMVYMTEAEQKKYMKKIEKELEEEFGSELRDLTITQGRILISLIDRETGDTSYELVKEMRGSMSAFFWQSLARVFGHNLKSNYDPDGEQKDIEEIVVLLEAGLI